MSHEIQDTDYRGWTIRRHIDPHAQTYMSVIDPTGCRVLMTYYNVEDCKAEIDSAIADEIRAAHERHLTRLETLRAAGQQELF